MYLILHVILQGQHLIIWLYHVMNKSCASKVTIQLSVMAKDRVDVE